MSRSLLVTGVFGNNRKNIAGFHLPENNPAMGADMSEDTKHRIMKFNKLYGVDFWKTSTKNLPDFHYVEIRVNISDGNSKHHYEEDIVIGFNARETHKIIMQKMKKDKKSTAESLVCETDNLADRRAFVNAQVQAAFERIKSFKFQ